MSSFLLLDNLSSQDMYGLLARRHLRNARIIMAILLACFLGYLVMGPKPWDRKLRLQIAERVAQAASEQGAESGRPPKLKLEHYVIPAAYTAAGINALGALFLLLTVGAWARPAPDIRAESGDNGLIVDLRAWWDSAWWFWGLLGLVALLGLGLRMSHSGKSIWWDEAWTVKRVIVGYQEPLPDQPEELTFRRASWMKTFFQYDKPTNHVGYSVCARFCVDTWRTLTGGEPASFDEAALRFPAVMAGILAIALAGMLVRDLGHPWLGLLVALLLALHPWHIRYSVDARAFAFCTAFSLLAVWALGRGLRLGSWRYWVLFAFANLMLVWSFPYAVFLVALLGAAGAFGIMAAHGSRGLPYLVRMAVCGAVAAMLLLQATAPWVAQVQHWGGTMDEDGVEAVDIDIVREFWVQSVTGAPWKTRGVEAEDNLYSQEEVISKLPLPIRVAGYALIFGVLPLAALGGCFHLAVSRMYSGLLIFVPLLALPLTLGIAILRGDWFYERYIIFGLPFVIIVVVLGAFHLLAGMEGSNRVPGLIGVGLFSAMFLLMSTPQLVRVISRPVEPLRDVARFFEARRGANPTLPIRAGYQHGGAMPSLYDPWIRVASSPEDLRAMAEEAKEKKASFFVFYGHENFNRGMFKEAFAYLDNPLLFARRAHFPGIEADYDYQIYEYSGMAWPELEKVGDSEELTTQPQIRMGEVELREAEDETEAEVEAGTGTEAEAVPAATPPSEGEVEVEVESAPEVPVVEEPMVSPPGE